MKPLRILILDDEENIRKSLGLFLRMHDFEVETAALPSEALKKLAGAEFHVLITDVRMPEMSGIDLAEKAGRLHPGLAVLVVTAFGNVKDAVRVVKQGAYNYLTKPLDQEELLVVLRRIEERFRMIWEVAALREKLKSESPYEELVGVSAGIREIYSRIEKAARCDFPVLIGGETGTGKELVARAIHHNSPRRKGPLVAVNCGALSETLMESELFGHVKGSFTGAVADRKGKIRAAHGGTLFLDEISTLSPAAQVNLLRVMDERRFTPVGSDSPTEADIRVVAASNEELSAAVEEKRFREDLYYRLNVIRIEVPPLRERKEDIPLLVRHILKELDRPDLNVSSGAMNLLLNHDWPGNIRELENAIKGSLALIDGDTLLLEHFPANLRPSGPAAPADDSGRASFSDRVAIFEKTLIEEQLRKTRGNAARAAREMGIPLRTLRRKMSKYSISARAARKNIS